MYKVLALDLDGTVLNDQQTIHPEVKQAIREAQECCHVIIVTGRHHTAAKPYYQELGLTTPIICCNGTYVYDYEANKVLKEHSIRREDALDFIDLAQQYQMKLVMYETEAMTYSKCNPIAYMKALEKWAEQFPTQQRPKIKRIASFIELARTTQYIWKFVIEGQPHSIERFANQEWIKQTFSGERSWSNRIDFSAQGNSKGLRLAEYVTELGYDATHVIAVGDNENDMSMIRYAGLGIAMDNAANNVKQSANLICATDNNQDGLAHLIREKIQG
ncbi:Cof-type HAD-IIB family hydrolase [Vibrio nitrifigilis]|uniref:Cof-type HAD-IIB family hydrolase n=1 Tax=Vibrio nitrifigilis TaxID=2789781 RepID=A0ABS0GFA9_9VIBR|nr:Cof-type HAD-IIB family hydrolase [Vibrio nitrifigilis]MBF9000923.1 Cof-type HAD-IIB family hydrolase [Vibrio nitrifigilis]